MTDGLDQDGGHRLGVFHVDDVADKRGTGDAAIGVIFAANIKGDGGAAGKELAQDLRVLVEKQQAASQNADDYDT